MVRPVTSKRKLFNNSKDQFKENEPDQVTVRESDSFDPKTLSITSSPFASNKSLNSSKRNLAETSRCEGKKDKEIQNCLEWHKKCDTEDGGTVFSGGRPAMPMSERQQIALLMQLSSPSPTNKSDKNSLNSPQTPTTPQYGRGIVKRNERGETPLHVAAIKGDCEKVSQLISQGANVNATDYAGWTALHEACNRGFYGIASLLIKGGADINAKGLDNDTPLHDACVNNHYQIVRLLLKSGAKTNAVNIRGKTPLDVCRSPGILALLEEADSGSLKLDHSDKDFTRIKLQELEIDGFERENTSLAKNNCGHTFSQLIDMSSRKTPPTNKGEEKLTPPPSTQSSISSSSSGSGTQAGNGVSGSGNGRPGSPRVTLRLPHVPRTPDKSQQRSHEAKNSENEDVYEFRCTKEESKEGDTEEKTGDSGSAGGVKSQESSSSDSKGDKRPRETDPDDEEELKKRRRKDDSKDSPKTVGGRSLGGGRITSSTEKGPKLGQRTSSSNGNNNSKQLSSTSICSTPSTNSTPPVSSMSTSNPSNTSSSSSTENRRSPTSVSSPKPSKGSPEKADSDNEDTKNESSTGAPKVPPLKIVLAPCSLSEQETSSSNGKNGSNRQLPYVVNSSSGNTEEKEIFSSDSKESTNVTDKEEANSGSNNGSNINITVPTTGAGSSTSTASANTSTITTVSSMNNSSSSNNSSNGGSNITNTNAVSLMSSSSSSEKGSATRITRSQRGGGSGSGSGSNSSEETNVKSEPKSEEQVTSTDVVHPRKRKLKMKEPEMEPPTPAALPEQPVTNCYEMFLKIRKQVEKRRKLLFPVQPKPPQGFKDYLMNRCSYVLANSSTSQLSVPVIPAPAALSQPLKDLFNEQEQERYKLRLQQLIEKEKLVLSVEQEILRVHGRAARALANQVVPFSVCTILKDEEVYNVISPEQEEKDRNARSRYNGRLFLSWLQDVDDKWEKIKEAMVLRHHNEAESLHAVQKMDWEWKLKEIGLIEPNIKTQIDELHVPMVQVADFDLLPA